MLDNQKDLEFNEIQRESLNSFQGRPRRRKRMFKRNSAVKGGGVITLAKWSSSVNAHLIFVTGGACGEKICHAEKVPHMSNCYVEKFST